MALFDYPVLRVKLSWQSGGQSKSALFQYWPLRCLLPPPWYCARAECGGWGPCLSFGGYFSFPGTQNKRAFDVIHLNAPSCICYDGSCWALNKITTSLVISQILILFRTHIWQCTFQKPHLWLVLPRSDGLMGCWVWSTHGWLPTGLQTVTV